MQVLTEEVIKINRDLILAAGRQAHVTKVDAGDQHLTIAAPTSIRRADASNGFLGVRCFGWRSRGCWGRLAAATTVTSSGGVAQEHAGTGLRCSRGQSIGCVCLLEAPGALRGARERPDRDQATVATRPYNSELERWEMTTTTANPCEDRRGSMRKLTTR